MVDNRSVLMNIKCPLCDVDIKSIPTNQRKFNCRACKIKLGINDNGLVYINKKGETSLLQSSENRHCPDCKNEMPPIEPNTGRFTICSNCDLWVDNLEADESIIEYDSPYFCPDCEEMLPAPTVDCDYVKCHYCDAKIPVSVFKEESYAEYTFNKIKPPLSQEEMGIKRSLGPMVDKTCPKCHHEGMIYNTMQTRSVDEGQTVFYFCPGCGFRDVENS